VNDILRKGRAHRLFSREIRLRWRRIKLCTA
jgi:hypothetical protein